MQVGNLQTCCVPVPKESILECGFPGIFAFRNGVCLKLPLVGSMFYCFYVVFDSRRQSVLAKLFDGSGHQRCCHRCYILSYLIVLSVVRHFCVTSEPSTFPRMGCSVVAQGSYNVSPLYLHVSVSKSISAYIINSQTPWFSDSS